MEEHGFRPITAADLALVLEWRNSDRIRRCMFTDHLISMEEHMSWFERTQDQNVPTFLLYERMGVPTGVVSFSRIDHSNGTCHWGFYIGRTDRPKGSGIIMGRLGIDYAFNQLEMRKIYGEVLACNEASIGFHDRLGFTKEGVLRKHVCKYGRYWDVIVFGLLKQPSQSEVEGE